jgi:hypothetical protein
LRIGEGREYHNKLRRERNLVISALGSNPAWHPILYCRFSPENQVCKRASKQPVTSTKGECCINNVKEQIRNKEKECREGHQLKEKEERGNGKNRLQKQKILNNYSQKQADPGNI